MPNEWYATDRKDNAVATATKAASNGAFHVIRSINAEFSDASVAGTITIKSGTATIAVLDFTGYKNLTGLAIKGAQGELVSAAITAGGSTGKFGSVIMCGETV